MNLPSSFRHIRVDNDTYRANLFTVEDINAWIEEYRSLTCTTWNTKISNLKCTRIACRKEFVCQHSSLRKIDANKRKRGVSKNFGCQAAINISIKIITESTKKSDKFIREGLPAKITFKNNHEHPAETKSFQKPLKEVKNQFIEYFNQGLGITESIKNYESKLLSQHVISDNIDVSNSLIFPKQRCVRSWYTTWCKTNNITPPRSRQKSKSKSTLDFLILKENGLSFEMHSDESDQIINNVAFEQNIGTENSNSDNEMFQQSNQDENLTIVQLEKNADNENSKFEKTIDSDNSNTSAVKYVDVNCESPSSFIVSDGSFFNTPVYQITHANKSNHHLQIDHQYENCFKDNSQSNAEANKELIKLIEKKLTHYGLPNKQIRNIYDAVDKIKSSKDFYNIFNISKR